MKIHDTYGFLNSFIEVYSTYIIHSLWVYNLLIFSKYIQLCGPSSFREFPKKFPYAHLQLI